MAKKATVVTWDAILKVMKEKKYKIFESGKKNYDLNIVGVRTADDEPNSFNDMLYVGWYFNDQWYVMAFPCTTDPGLYWLKEPMNDMGTAIVKPGQYPGMLEVGLHRGKYTALTQKGDVTVIRDFDRDNYLDLNSGKEETGVFGINVHRANSKLKSIRVDRWSAGCQVLNHPTEFGIFMNLCRLAIKEWGNSFTYTLLTENDF